MTSLFAAGLLAYAFLYWKGWAGVTFTGITRPLCQVSLFGFNFWIKHPEKKDA